MSPVDLNPWLQLINGALAVGAVVYAWIASRRKGDEERFKGIEARLNAVERVASDSPARSEIHQVALNITQMSGELRVIAAEMRGSRDLMQRLENVVARHEEHLMKDRK